ncbi:MAG: hypothetical protein ACOCUV_00315 [bacterium]
MSELICPWDSLIAAWGHANIKWCEESLCAWITSGYYLFCFYLQLFHPNYSNINLINFLKQRLNFYGKI